MSERSKAFVVNANQLSMMYTIHINQLPLIHKHVVC